MKNFELIKRVMKELSIEEKAKAYDGAKLRMSAAYNSNRCTIGFMNGIFPELKESEDEEIKELLIRHIKQERGSLSNDEAGKCIAWLENQGDANKEYWRGYREGKKEIIDKYSELEKQGEYKSTDKVEPKFKVNELVVTGINDVVQIKAVNNGHYTIDNGMEFNMPYVDRYWHKWTIQDAKDGDVLSYRDGQWCFIYKGIVTEDTFRYYALLSEKGITVNDVAFSLLTSCIIPATKKQRDTLMKAMADAGYAFDFVKKELKKIVTPKFKIGDKVYSLKNRFECTIESIDETTYYGDTTNFDIKDQNNWKLVEQNPAWSEEDEDYINDLIKYFSQNERLNNTKEDIVNWLESLRPKNTWKPSDKQMEALGVMTRYCDIATSFDAHKQKVIESLCQDLKKLKEE